jgi:hypothetical protein
MFGNTINALSCYIHSFFFAVVSTLFASNFSSLFSLLPFGLAGDDPAALTADEPELWVDCSTAFDPHRAHWSNWSISGAMPSSMLTLASTK